LHQWQALHTRHAHATSGTTTATYHSNTHACKEEHRKAETTTTPQSDTLLHTFHAHDAKQMQLNIVTSVGREAMRTVQPKGKEGEGLLPGATGSMLQSPSLLNTS
jgi:hypothetical protein